MTTRYNYKWKKPDVISCPDKEDYELIVQIEPISYNEDKTIKEYIEKSFYKCSKSKWHDFIKSFNLGTISEQIINHLTKGTPLVTAPSLPDGDYTAESFLKGAAIKREMNEKGITLDMIIDAVRKANAESRESEVSE